MTLDEAKTAAEWRIWYEFQAILHVSGMPSAPGGNIEHL